MVSVPSKPDKKYFANPETEFKYCCRNHKKDFRHKKYVSSTGLSKYISKLKDENVVYMCNQNSWLVIYIYMNI